MLVDNPGGLPRGNTDDPPTVRRLRDGVPSVIDTTDALERVAAELGASSQPVALDVERAHGFRYTTNAYLVQIRREDVGTYLIDTHALPDLSALAPALDATWILHDASQDLTNLRDLNLHTTDLFDTEVGARLIGLQRFGLAAVCEQVLGFSLAKDHQASDWSVRPLPTDWLRYAALDVEFLTELYRRLSITLHDMDRWELAQEEFAHVLHAPAPTPKTHHWRGIKGLGKLRSRRALAVARELWLTREEIARDKDLERTRVVRNSDLLKAAQRPPTNRRQLRSLDSFRSPITRPYTTDFLDAIERARRIPEDQLPPKRVTHPAGTIPEARLWQRLDEHAHERLLAVREAVAGVAEQLGLAPEVVLEPRVQRFVCWAPLKPLTPEALDQRLDEGGARAWQRELVSQCLFDALR